MACHGTNLWRAADIFWTGQLRPDVSPLWPDTSPGPVYVTVDFTSAVRYAAKATTAGGQASHPDRPVGAAHVAVIFAFLVDRESLRSDPDDEALEIAKRGRPQVRFPPIPGK